jgi:hypothetical protein
MRQVYTDPRMEVVEMAPQQIICTSPDGWAEMGGYQPATDGFSQP